MSETKLQEAERHVRESEDRISKQKALIAELRRAGREESLSIAMTLLENQEKFHRLAVNHLELERAES